MEDGKGLWFGQRVKPHTNVTETTNQPFTSVLILMIQSYSACTLMTCTRFCFVIIWSRSEIKLMYWSHVELKSWNERRHKLKPILKDVKLRMSLKNPSRSSGGELVFPGQCDDQTTSAEGGIKNISTSCDGVLGLDWTLRLSMLAQKQASAPLNSTRVEKLNLSTN